MLYIIYRNKKTFIIFLEERKMEKIKIYGVCNRLSYENVVGDTIISSPYGLNYFIYECFKPGKEPVLYDDTKSSIITKKLKHTKLNEKRLYNPECL